MWRRGRHLVVQDFQVRAQHHAWLAAQCHAAQALAHLGLVRTGAMRLWALATTRSWPAARASTSVCALVWAASSQVCTCCSSTWPAGSRRGGSARLGTLGLQLQRGALQVVAGARGHQGLGVVRALGEPCVHMLGHAVVRLGQSQAQML